MAAPLSGTTCRAGSPLMVAYSSLTRSAMLSPRSMPSMASRRVCRVSMAFRISGVSAASGSPASMTMSSGEQPPQASSMKVESCTRGASSWKFSSRLVSTWMNQAPALRGARMPRDTSSTSEGRARTPRSMATSSLAYPPSAGGFRPVLGLPKASSAGSTARVATRASRTPMAAKVPKVRTGTTSFTSSAAKPAAVVKLVNRQGRVMASRVSITASLRVAQWGRACW